MAGRLEQFEQVEVATRAEWREWLFAHHGQSESIWVVTFKVGASRPRVPYDELVEEALAFGWVDSLPRKLDDDRSMLLMSPRKPGSNWSAINKARVARMTAAGLIHPAGLAKIDRAKADGSWNALDSVDRLEVPIDLRAEFDARPGSAAAFAGFPSSTRRGILEWISNAKRPETRLARVVETAEKAALGERANQWRGRA